jgi:DNA topoisomerase-1
VLDRIVGYKISPLLWRKVRKGLSAGRVQSVTARLICDREEEIEKFVAEEYWSIAAKLTDPKSKAAFEAKFYGSLSEKIELKNEQQVSEIIEKVKNANYSVKKIKASEKRKTPAPPFITSSMQQEAARKIGFTTKKTMMVAQQLYEGIDVKGFGAVGLVTYIRSDSTRIAKEAQDEARSYIKERYGEKYVPQDLRVYKNKSASQDAHEAIRPTHINLEPDKIKESLNNDQYKLYKLVWERFVASQMASAIYDTVSIDITADNYLFKANGSKVKFLGFSAVYTEGRDEEAEEAESNIPEVVEGQKLGLKKLDPKQHFTQPPSRYTEATLVKTLEEKGIGRPSTYAPIITTIQARGYVEKEKKFLIPTELGKIVTEIMKNNFVDIVDVQFTAQLERKLDDIEEGDKKWVEVLKDFYSPFDDVLKKAEESIGRIDVPDEVTDIICEKCGRNMVIKNGRFGKFLACPGFPECRNTRPIKEEAGVNCPKCGGKVLFKKTRKGKRYLGCENNPTCDFMTWDKPDKGSCPKCGNFLVKKYSGKKAIVKCSNDKCDYQKNE